jgi:hypothetical protein
MELISFWPMLITLTFWEKTIQKNTEALLDDIKEAGLKVNSEKNKYVLISCKKEGQKHSTKIWNSSFESVAIFKYL